MKYMDWAAMGAASSAFGEASRAQAGVNQLGNEIQLIKEDINSQKYEREFQKWAEELIYQFSKTVRAISESPADPVTDYADLLSFFRIIEDNKINTSIISGFEHKSAFEQTLLKAQGLISQLKENPQVQEFLQRQEAARREEERLQAEEAAMAYDAAMAAQETRRMVWFIFMLSIVLGIGAGVAAFRIESNLFPLLSLMFLPVAAYCSYFLTKTAAN